VLIYSQSDCNHASTDDDWTLLHLLHLSIVIGTPLHLLEGDPWHDSAPVMAWELENKVIMLKPVQRAQTIGVRTVTADSW
jgi:hypothetical protein